MIIPASNAHDLMLRQDVRAAAAQGKFAVYTVEHADQVMGLLTGMPAGRPDANGLYLEETCNGQIQRRLFDWTAVRQQLSNTVIQG